MIDIQILNKLNAPTREERLENLKAVLKTTQFPPDANACVRKGQKLEALCEDEYDQGIVPQEGTLEIVYEDEELLILNKPAPLATLPMPGQELNTLANRVAFYFGRDKFIFRPVNRLDKGTSGLMAVAKLYCCI